MSEKLPGCADAAAFVDELFAKYFAVQPKPDLAEVLAAIGRCPPDVALVLRLLHETAETLDRRYWQLRDEVRKLEEAVRRLSN